jgi:predicted 3-demethylubiquinone-9 3-methyltransferase (glyoxalase superfamily)
VLTVEFELDGQGFTALNGGPVFVPNASVSFFVHVDSAAEADRIFSALEQAGQVLMPLGAYPWSERYGWVQDRFGVSWQVITGRRPRQDLSIVACLMFAGAQHGKAESAMRFFSGIFPAGEIESVEHYAAGEGPEGTVKHGRVALDGQLIVAMDSHVDHGIRFSEGISLQVMCEDQAAIDHYWERLADGGSHGVCGWLKDRFGISWQVVPSSISEWIACEDREARDRAFIAMLGMKKLDIEALRRAVEGRKGD